MTWKFFFSAYLSDFFNFKKFITYFVLHLNISIAIIACNSIIGRRQTAASHSKHIADIRQTAKDSKQHTDRQPADNRKTYIRQTYSRQTDRERYRNRHEDGGRYRDIHSDRQTWNRQTDIYLQIKYVRGLAHEGCRMQMLLVFI